jgi:hypothetical protein
MTNIDSIQLASIFGGVGVPVNPTKTEPTTTAPTTTAPTTTQPTTQQGPSLWGNVCRTGFTALGGAIGAGLTSETGGWGGVPGAMVGQAVGTSVCPP